MLGKFKSAAASVLPSRRRRTEAALAAEDAASRAEASAKAAMAAAEMARIALEAAQPPVAVPTAPEQQSVTGDADDSERLVLPPPYMHQEGRLESQLRDSSPPGSEREPEDFFPEEDERDFSDDEEVLELLW